MDDNKPMQDNPTPMPESSPQMPTQAVETTGPAFDSVQNPSPQPSEPFQLPIQQPKRSKTPLIWIVIVVLLVAIVAGIWYFVTGLKQSTTNSATSTSPSPSTSQTLDAQAVVGAVKQQKVQGSLMQITNTDALSGKTGTGMIAYMASFYQLSGKDFAANPQQAYGTAYHGSKSITSADYQTVSTYLTSHDFKSVTYPYPDNSTDVDPTYVKADSYVSKTAFCTIRQQDYSESSSPDAFKDNLLSVWCADLSSYSANASTLQPFFDAYAANPSYKKTSDPLGTPVLTDLLVTDGVEGYKNATVNISTAGAIVGGGAGFYYQEPGKNWAFLKTTQDALYCSDLSTTAIKKSFGNQTCFNTKTNASVKVSTLL